MAHYGAVTAFSAEMLAAKIHLNQGNYGEVETLTDDIIGSKKFKLYDDYYNLFKIPGKVCDESLFECQCTDFGLGSGDMVDADNWFVFKGRRTTEIFQAGDLSVYIKISVIGQRLVVRLSVLRLRSCWLVQLLQAVM